MSQIKGLAIIEELAGKILIEDPDPVVRFLLLRDVLKRPLHDQELILARRELSENRWVQLLEQKQWEDGSWGRLHSQDTQAKQKIATTEYGVDKAIGLGLDADHPILSKAFRYLAGILETGACRDRPENNDRWPTGVRLFIASAISKIHPNSPVIDGVWEHWAEITRRAFASGIYNHEAERLAHRELTGIKSKLGYLTLNSKYHVTLLGSRAELLDRGLEEAYVNWIWNEMGYIGYLSVSLNLLPDQLQKRHLGYWVHAIELLSAFKCWRKYAADAIDWLWQNRNSEGFWDLGQVGDTFFRLSKSWRTPNRQHDWSTRILALLRRFYDENSY
jgi:hypothetical protein